MHLYMKIIDDIKIKEERTLEYVYMHLSRVLDSAVFDRVVACQTAIILEERLPLFEGKLQNKVRYYLNRYKNVLLLIYILLKEPLTDQQLQAISLPFAIDNMLSSSSGLCFIELADIACLYAMCSVFMPFFMKIMQGDLSLASTFVLSGSESICLSMNFNDLHSLYLNQGFFLQQMLEQPLRMFKKIPTLEGYDFYQRVDLTHLLDAPSCIASSSLINRQYTDLIQPFNYYKFINFGKLFDRKPLTNNALLNAIQRLAIPKVFSFCNSQQKLSSKSLCLTFPISNHHLSKIRPFLESLPPQIAPLGKHDILSYGFGQFNKLFYRMATEDYWEHCPQSEFVEIYYLINESAVQWISMPTYEYLRSDKIRFWNEQQLENLTLGNKRVWRGMQKRGDFVVIGQGHQHFWKVRRDYGMAVLLKWSIFLKSETQIKRHIEIVQDREMKEHIAVNWKIDFPHRNILFNYLAHEHLMIDPYVAKKIIKFIQSKLKSEQSSLNKFFIQYQKQVMIKKSTVPAKFRLCGLCGSQILNVSAFLKSNSICLSCMPQAISNEDKSFRFYINCMCKPSSLDGFFNKIEKSTRATRPRKNIYEEVYCQGSFLGYHQKCRNSAETINTSDNYANHLVSVMKDLEMHVFLSRSNYCSAESAVKTYGLKLRASKQEHVQMKTLLAFLGRNCFTKQERKKIRDWIYCYYLENNYVLEVLTVLQQEVEQ